MPTELAQDLLDYIDASPTPWHAVAESARRLEAHGYARKDERDLWQLGPGDRFYAVRGGTSLAAFRLGQAPLAEAGFRLVGAHTDSPNLRLKPNPQYARGGCLQLGVEVYGGALWYSWLDRDLSLAGRVVLVRGGVPTSHLVDLGRRPLARVPSLAIHLQREVNSQGLKLNPQEHLAPLFALESLESPQLLDLMCEALGGAGVAAEPKDVLGFDLCLYDVVKGALGGAKEEFLHAARLDNLASCHAGLTALLGAQEEASTAGVVLYDHEEIGSRSAQGADSPFLRDCLERIALCTGAGSQDLHRALQASFLVSADMAHALHPNFLDKHEPRHQPLLGGGPVVKTNVNHSYATDGESWARLAAWAQQEQITLQHFVVRTDLPCGGTIGPITAGKLGIRAIDIGSPMLSMHSIREMAAVSDVEKMVALLRRAFAG